MTGEKSADRHNTARELGIELGITARLCVSLYRLSRWFCKNRMGGIGRIVQLFNRIVTGADIDLAATVSPKVLIPHTIGVVIGATSIVEDGVVLMPHVVLGARFHATKERRHPHLCRNVSIGAGAVLLGPITVGEGAKVGANAVVVDDVAPGETVVGIPARRIEKAKKDNA